MLNRGVVIVRPKQPYLDWAAGLDDSGLVPDPNGERTIYLIPSYEDEEAAALEWPPVVELTAENTDQVVVKVRNGTLLLFPAYLHHSVDPNMSEHERVSLSFNVMFSSFTETLSKPLW